MPVTRFYILLFLFISGFFPGISRSFPVNHASVPGERHELNNTSFPSHWLSFLIPTITIRCANAQYDCNTDEFCLDVQFQSDIPNQELFGMNVRFFYEDDKLEFSYFKGFVGGYSPIAPNPPFNHTSASAGPALFGFEGGVDYINGAIQLTNENLPPVFISTNDWTTIFQLCFSVDESNSEDYNIAPAIIWDLEQEGALGGFLPGSDGIVMTAIDNNSEGTIPVIEQAIHYNWEYSGDGSPPYGQPVPTEFTDVSCAPNLSCPPNVTISCGASTLPSNTGIANAIDFCQGDPVISYSDAQGPGDCPAGFLIFRTWVVTDNCGNTSSCQQIISVGSITCSLLVTNTHDSGSGSLRAAIVCANPGDTIVFDSASLADSTILITTTRISINKNIFIHSDVIPRIKISSQIPGLFEIGPDSLVEFFNLDILSGTAIPGNAGAAFNNFGSLILIDTKVIRKIGLADGEYLIRNRPLSNIAFYGNCFIEVP